MSVISRLNEFPLDIVGVIGLHLSARGFASLLQVSSTFYKLFNQVHEDIARAEQERMGIEFQAIPLNAWQTAEQWGQLTSQEARALRIDLRGRPLIFYAGINPAMLVLQDKFLTVRNDQTALSNLALGHLDLKQAAILASQITDKELRAAAIQAIVGRAIDENLPESTILEFVSNLVSAEMPMDKIRKTLKKIPGEAKKRDMELRILALKNGIEIGKAISIALLIWDPGKLECTLCDIANIVLKDDIDDISLKHLVYIKGLLKDYYTSLQRPNLHRPLSIKPTQPSKGKS